MWTWVSDHVLGSTDSQESKIDWNDFNYPPCLNIIHFAPSEDLGESKPRYKTIIQQIPHLLLIVVCIINIVNNGVQTGFYGGFWPRLLISFFFTIMVIPLEMFIFYTGYRIYTCNAGSPLVYYAISGVLLIVSVIYMIANFLNANGWVRAGECSGYGLGLCTALSAIEGIVFLLIGVARVFSVIFIYRR